MPEIRDQIEQLGFRLARQDGGHLVYRHTQNSNQLYVAKTPSDYRAAANTLAEARRLAGVSKQGQEARAGERRKRRRGQPPAAIDPRAAGPAIPMVAKPAQVPLPRPVAEVVEPEAPSVRNVPVAIKNLRDYEPKPKPLPKVPIAHIRAVDNLPKGMRDRVLKLAKGDYSKIKILADNRVEVSQ